MAVEQEASPGPVLPHPVVYGHSQQAGTGPEHLVVGPVEMKLTESVPV